MVTKFSALKPLRLDTVTLRLMHIMLCSLLDAAETVGTTGVYNLTQNPTYPIEFDTIATEVSTRGWIRSGLGAEMLRSN